MKEKVGSQMSNGAIAGSLNLSEIKVAYITSNSRRADGGERKDSRGHRKLLSPRELRGLRRLVEENWLACLWEIAGKLNAGRTDPPAGHSQLLSVSNNGPEIGKGHGNAVVHLRQEAIGRQRHREEAPPVGERSSFLES